MKVGTLDIQKLMSYPHKTGVNKMDWAEVHPNLIKLAFFYIRFCELRNLPILFTSIIRAKIPGFSKTDIHAKKRAFDVSVKGWTSKDIHDFVEGINAEFTVGAISLSDGEEREAVWEDGVTAGKGPHLHVQVRP